MPTNELVIWCIGSIDIMKDECKDLNICTNNNVYKAPKIEMGEELPNGTDDINSFKVDELGVRTVGYVYPIFL